MKGGWFIGNFSPSALQTPEFEVAIKEYKAGDSEPNHVHKQAIEITVIVKGTVEMSNRLHREGEIIFLDKGDATTFRALTDVITVVVKTPSVSNDKFIIDGID